MWEWAEMWKVHVGLCRTHNGNCVSVMWRWCAHVWWSYWLHCLPLIDVSWNVEGAHGSASNARWYMHKGDMEMALECVVVMLIAWLSNHWSTAHVSYVHYLYTSIVCYISYMWRLWFFNSHTSMNQHPTWAK